jgi:hypothetical protein
MLMLRSEGNSPAIVAVQSNTVLTALQLSRIHMQWQCKLQIYWWQENLTDTGNEVKALVKYSKGSMWSQSCHCYVEFRC